MQSRRSSRPIFVVAVVLVCAGSVVVGLTRSPLVDVHWDTAFFLGQAKAFAETRYLVDYRRHAADIAVHVPADERGFSEAYSQYWFFARIGHIATLGSIFALLGTTRGTIDAAYWIYRALLALALILALPAVVLLVRRLDRGPREDLLWTGATISAALYVASDIYAYTSGNLVTETPSLLLLSAAVLLFELATERRSSALAACSGIAAFVLYTTHFDSLWPYLAFVGLYVAWPAVGARAWRVAAIALATALACYLAYLWYFFPLPSPQIYWTWAHLPEDQFEKGMLAGFRLFVRYVSICGGLLWVGAALAVLLRPRSPALRLALTWAAMIVLPALPLALVSDTQTRMFTSVFPALLAASTVGWTALVDALLRGTVAARGAAVAATLAVGLMLLNSHPLLFHPITAPLARVRGLWRLESARPFLRVPERLSYPPAELEAVSRAIYSDAALTTIVARLGVRPTVTSVVRFFGPPYRAGADVVASNRRHHPSADEAVDPVPDGERAAFRDAPDVATLRRAMARGMRVVMLRARDAAPSDASSAYADAFDRTPLVTTRHYSLERLRPREDHQLDATS